MKTLLLAVVLVGAVVAQVHQNGLFEIRLQVTKDYENPLNVEDTTVEFKTPNGKSEKVRAFWDGGREWVVRYSPEAAGQYSWRAALTGKTGTFRASAYKGKNTLYSGGQPRLS